jgi:hypothetical protein
MTKKIKKILKPYQFEHVQKLYDNLLFNNVCFETSDTGTGKTYMAIAVAKMLMMKVFIVCPKTIVSFWRDVCSIFGVEMLGISNYSLLIKCKYYDEKNSSTACPYIEKSDDYDDFTWTVPKNTLIIFDEVHRCCNPNAYSGKLLLSLKNIYCDSICVLLISATVCENPSKFRLFSVLLKWFDHYNNVDKWLYPDYNIIAASEIINNMLKINNMACGVKIKDLGDLFQTNQILSEYYDIDSSDAEKIDTLHQQIIKSIGEINNKKETDKKIGYTVGMRQKQEIELIKIQIFVNLVKEYLDDDFSVILFLNFTETIKILSKELKTNCILYGEQTIHERLKNIKDFVEDKERIIICNIHSGGDSVSLNDQNGKYKRISLISPTWSSIKLIQACGRNCRINSKTPSINKIIYANTKIEKIMCNKLKEKCSAISSITNSDLIY